MNLPSQHQLAVAGTHIATAGATAVATLGMVHLLNPDQVNSAGQAITQIGTGVSSIMTGAGTLVALASGIYAAITSGPLASLFRATKAIAASPELTEQVKVSAIADKAPLVALTDKLPEVVGVGTTRDDAGKALAAAVPSASVQTVTAVPPIAKVI